MEKSKHWVVIETLFAKSGKVYTSVIARFPSECLAKEYAEDRTEHEDTLYSQFGDGDPYYRARFDVEYEGE